jgi:type II secretory pathway component PulK
MVLPIVLLMLILLGLLAANSAFYVHADLSATYSASHRLQARLAAEAGLQKVMLFLRTERGNVDAWYHNAEEFHRILVWTEHEDLELLGTNHEFEDSDRSIRYRFSIVADNPDDDEKLIRFGVTDESSKLNINTATREQLVSLISRFTTEEMNVDELVDALIDWRDEDNTPREFGAEDQYYAQLDPPYKVKNADFDTVEELLLVRGFKGRLLYGEDYDRNGLMSPNENDGDERFPPDDMDDTLNVGLYPYVTVYSRDTNTTSENKPRVYLFGDSSMVQAQLREFITDQAKLNYIATAGEAKPRIESPAELLKDREQKTSEEPLPSPLTDEDMMVIMDRTTTSPAPELVGLININTAQPIVLSTLPDLTEEEIAEIVTMRAELAPERKRSTAWILPIIGREKFLKVAPLISARGTRFRVESLGYADHMGTMARLEAVVEMRGPVAQIVYLRDLTKLGTNFPVQWAEDDAELIGYDD